MRQRIVKVLFLALAAGALFRELRLPAARLDPSWMLAMQYGLLHHIDFSRYLHISYGPLSVLTSDLFHPATFWLTITFQILCVVIVFWPAVGSRWSGPVLAVLATCVLADCITYLNDGIVFAAIYSSFLLHLLGRRIPALLSAVAIGVLSLSKSSFFFAAAPLFLLADLHGWAHSRDRPLQFAVLLASLAVAFVLCGQPPSSLLEYLRNAYVISRDYGDAMSLPLGSAGLAELLPFVAFSLGLAILLLVRARARPEPQSGQSPQSSRLTLVAAAIGLVWLSFVMYKASYGRLDREHSSIGWNGLLLITPVILFVSWRFLGKPAALRRGDIAWSIGACAVFLLTANIGLPLAQNLPASIAELAGEKLGNLTALAGWLNPSKWQAVEQQRVSRLEHIAVRGLDIGQESIDVYPYEIARVIAAGMNYQPRPAFQSYLAYSPYLQNLELAHWRSANAPAHVLFQLGDIDGRLPTLALGPSIVEVLSRYDALGPVGPTLHLRRRASARMVATRLSGATSLAPDQWVTIPNSPGYLTLASIQLETSLRERLTSFIDRPTFLNIELRLASGAIQRYRFVPPMAKLGFAISPSLDPLFADPAGFQANLTDRLRESPAVEAFRIVAADSADRAFGAGRVSFTLVGFDNPPQAAAAAGR